MSTLDPSPPSSDTLLDDPQEHQALGSDLELAGVSDKILEEFRERQRSAGEP
jgi:hypothetical protein